MTGDTVVTVERHIAAGPATVYAYLTDSERWSRWQGEQATIGVSSGGSWPHAHPEQSPDLHEAGWIHYLGRLMSVAEGGDPGPDPGPGN